jgi:hypothetical protein
MGLFSWLSQTPKVVDTASDLATNLASGVDMIFYTEEEKAQARQKSFDAWLDMTKSLGPSSARDITRRVIAVMVMLTCIMLTFIGVFAAASAKEHLAEVTLGFFAEWWKIAIAVSVFYFGPHVLGAFSSKKK